MFELKQLALFVTLWLGIVSNGSAVGQTNSIGSFRKITTIGVHKDKTASIAFGDIDGDGDQDLIVANGRHWPGQNRVFINDGKGAVAEQNLFDQHDNTYATPLADLDGDGDLDVVVGNDRMPSYVLLNQGDGTFERSQQIGAASATRSITLADLDKQNGIDILVTNRGEPNRIFLNDGKGNFERGIPFGSQDDSTIDVAVADLNGDGHNDLALANRDGQPNFIYFGDGTGRFSSSAEYGTGNDETRGVAIADADGDGLLDIVNANIGQPNAIYFGDGKGGFNRATSFGDKAKSYDVACVRLRHDSKTPMIIIANVGSQNAAYLRNADGSLQQVLFGDKPTLIGLHQAATYAVAAADIDGDGLIEIATANSGQRNNLFRYVDQEN